MVPLVFKTSLEVVRSPEGSTPSLLRQDSRSRGQGDHDQGTRQQSRASSPRRTPLATRTNSIPEMHTSDALVTMAARVGLRTEGLRVRPTGVL